MRIRAHRRMWVFLVLIAGLVTVPAVVSAQAASQPSIEKGEWPGCTGDARGWRYSPLDQINASNFNELEVAWRFKTDSLGNRPEYKLEGTPLMVGGVLYTTAGTRRANGTPPPSPFPPSRPPMRVTS